MQLQQGRSCEKNLLVFGLLLTALAVGCCSSGCSSSEEANATPRFIVALPALVSAVVAVLWVVLWVVAVLFLRLLLLRILRRPMPHSMMTQLTQGAGSSHFFSFLLLMSRKELSFRRLRLLLWLCEPVAVPQAHMTGVQQRRLFSS